MSLDPIALKTLALELSAALPPPPPDACGFAPIDNSPRARRVRSILRIANRYGWHEAITHFLDMKGVAYLSDLSDVQIEDLQGRMDGFVDAAECGHYLPDSLPAT